ncbi:hypothetical protein C356_04171 [Cryptococcus neoformans c45]|nr:hypothetical protein C356_04171 [Cryptococcus neoformans var. grubii c45]
MSSRMDSGGGPSTPLEMADLPGSLPHIFSELVARVLQVLNLGQATLDTSSKSGAPTAAQRAMAMTPCIAKIMYAASIVYFLLSPAASIDHIDKAVHKSLYHFVIIFFQSLEDDEQKAILEFYAQRATVEEDQKDQVDAMWKSIRQWKDKRRLSKRPRL